VLRYCAARNSAWNSYANSNRTLARWSIKPGLGSNGPLLLSPRTARPPRRLSVAAAHPPPLQHRRRREWPFTENLGGNRERPELAGC